MRALLLPLLLAAAPAAAAPTLLVCYPGGPVKARQAKPAIAQMSTLLSKLAGIEGGFEARFENTAAGCEAGLVEKPALAILTLGGYLAHRADFEPLAQPKVKGEFTDTVSLVTNQAGPSTLEGFKGKAIGGTPLAEPELLKRVVFEGKLDPLTDFKAKETKRPLVAVRETAKGILDGALVTRVQHAAIASLPFADQLRTVWTSKPLPVVGLVAHKTATTPAQRKALQQAALGLCDHAEGKDLCALFGLEGFRAADAHAYDEAAKLWGE